MAPLHPGVLGKGSGEKQWGCFLVLWCLAARWEVFMKLCVVFLPESCVAVRRAPSLTVLRRGASVWRLHSGPSCDPEEQGGAAAWELWLQPEPCCDSVALQEVLWLQRWGEMFGEM